jgi:hypothetical protein
MHDGPTAVGSDLRIVFPDAGVIRVESARLFAAPDEEHCRRFLQAAMLVPAIEGATLASAQIPSIDLRFDVSRHRRKNVLERQAAALSSAVDPRREPLPVAPVVTARDRHGVVRYQRCAGRITGWRVERERVGSIHLKKPGAAP